ncbi:hypothetical protein ACFWBX_21165 [Streptomyces sp. NPDC059991]|uniref:hypothetical protein n=1 Tax=Streptomyces sp. NPDC059991 TaxID=3347028 RepID=UPI0036822446
MPLRHLAAATRAGVSATAPGTGSPLVVAALPGEVDDVFPLWAGVVLPPGSAAEVVLVTGGPAAAPSEGHRAALRRRGIEVAREQGHGRRP